MIVSFIRGFIRGFLRRLTTTSCLDCDGVGYRPIPYLYASVYLPCTLCRGTGRIE